MEMGFQPVFLIFSVLVPCAQRCEIAQLSCSATSSPRPCALSQALQELYALLHHLQIALQSGMAQ